MKKTLFSVLLMLCSVGLLAQQKDDTFRAYLYNNDYEVFLHINLYNQNIEVPQHELYGPVPGYLGKLHNSFCWVITSCQVKDDKKAELQLINDFGSEDLTASLERLSDSIYILKQVSGSTMRVPHKGKWRKLPKTLELHRR